MKYKLLRHFMHSIYGISGKIHQIRNSDILIKRDLKLNSAALSTLDVISRNATNNMSEISSLMGVTKGALSQMVQKLEKKELVIKYKSEHNAKEVFLRVTERGNEVLEEYRVLHDHLYQGISEILSQYREEDVRKITEFLEKTNCFLNSYKKDMEKYL